MHPPLAVRLRLPPPVAIERWGATRKQPEHGTAEVVMSLVAVAGEGAHSRLREPHGQHRREIPAGPEFGGTSGMLAVGVS